MAEKGKPGHVVSRADILAWREAARRPLWLPLTQAGQSDTNPNRFGGTPSLAAGETWPCCQTCGAVMPLFLQLDTGSLPTGAPLAKEGSAGLLQLFGCRQKSCLAFTQDGSALARVLPVAPRYPTYSTVRTAVLAPNTITGWQAETQEPTSDEWDEANGQLPPDFTDDDDAVDYPWFRNGRSRDKLGGWPDWVQFPEYSTCRVCERPHTLVFQLESEENLDFVFGDVGTAYLTYCAQHPDELTFSWQCS
ncbi:DUF1963 domain-containing protein [Hymenobacter koreensis]|uniref:DUF1963 domain-containing protein n=1 Tax=Hymenobacter koreensis TaxID=1084523 RepID=UPI0031F1BDF8